MFFVLIKLNVKFFDETFRWPTVRTWRHKACRQISDESKISHECDVILG